MNGEGATGSELAARELEGRYAIVKTIGTGAGGETFEALDARDGSKVALKRFAIGAAREWKALDLFRREAKVLASLRHPAIPELKESFDVETVTGTVSYLAHAFAPGLSLRGWVESGWHPDEAEVVRTGAFLLEVLAYLHAIDPPVIHRDIKPANVIRSNDGGLWLVDFGAVRDSAVTMSGGSTVVGTYGYMAPEQFRGHAVCSSDLYGVAATMLYLLSGRAPTELPQAKLRVAFRSEVHVSAPLADWLERALEPAPEDRFATAMEALTALRDAPRVRGRRTRFVLATLLGASVLAGGAFLGWNVVARKASSPPPSSEARDALPRPSPLPLRPPSRFAPLREPTVVGDDDQELVVAMALAEDDATLATANGRTVKLWDLRAGTAPWRLGEHDGRATGLAFTRDGKWLVSGGGSGAILWDAASGDAIARFDAPAVLDVVVSRDDSRVLAAGADGIIRIFDLATRALVGSIANGVTVFALATSPDGAIVAAGGKDGSIRTWSLPDGRPVDRWREHRSIVNDLTFARDGSALASASDDREVHVLSMLPRRDPEPRWRVTFADEAWGVAFSPDRSLVVSGSRDTRLAVNDGRDGAPLAGADTGAKNSKITFSHDGRALFVGAGSKVTRRVVARRGLGTEAPLPASDRAAAGTERHRVEPKRALTSARRALADHRPAEVVRALTDLVGSSRPSELVVEAYDLLAEAYLALGDIDGADACHRARIVLAAKDPAAHQRYAELLLVTGEPDAAASEARAAIALGGDPASRKTLAAAHVERGNRSLWRDGNADDALREFESATTLDPESALALYGRAAVHRFLAITGPDAGALAKARADLERALRLDTSWPELRRALDELPPPGAPSKPGK